MAIGFLFIGMAAGLLSGLLGIGGGIVIVPAMTALLVAGGQPLEAALSTALVTSLAAVLFNSLVASVGHALRGQLDVWPIRWLLVGAGAASCAVAQLLFAYHPPAVAQAVAVSQLLVAALLCIRRPMMAGLPRSAGMDAAYGAFAGAASALAGTGGAAYVAAYLLHRDAATPFRRVAAAGTAIGAMIGFGAMVGYAAAYLRLGKALSAKMSLLPPDTLGILLVGGLIAAPIGVRWSVHCRGRLPRLLLGAAVAVSAVRLLTLSQ
jgi:uncharacterized membrane protein YfcA